jgi:hypothetical protein
MEDFKLKYLTSSELKPKTSALWHTNPTYTVRYFAFYKPRFHFPNGFPFHLHTTEHTPSSTISKNLSAERYT